MELESTNSGPTAKIPILKLGEYEMWAIRIKQYFQIQEYALWEVIENGDSWVSISQTTEENGITTTNMSTPATAEEKTKKKNDVKARGLLLMILEALEDSRRLAILSVISAKGDLNLKILSNLPPEWNTHVKVKKTNGTSSGVQNLAFITAPSSSSTNDANTASSQVSAARPVFKDTSPVHKLAHASEQIHEDDLEAIDLKWQLSLLSVRAKKWSVTAVLSWDTLPGSAEHQEARKVSSEIKTTPGSKETKRHFQDNVAMMVARIHKAWSLGIVRKCLFVVCEKESDNSKENSDKSLVKEQESQVKSSFVEGCGSNTSKSVSEVEPKKVRENNDAPIIEEWVSDDEEQDESKTKPEKKIVIPTAAKIEKPVKKSVRYAEMYRSQSPRGNQRNWNGQKSNQLGSEFVMYNKACFICGSFNHVQRNCTYHQKKKVVSGNNYNRVDNYYYAKTSHHRTHKNVTPRAVLLRTGLKPLSTAKSVYTAHPKPTVHCARPKTHFYKSAQSTVQRPFYKKPALTNRHFNHKGKPQQYDKGFVNSGCSRHMIGNIAYLSDFKEFKGGYVAFGGGAYGGRVTGKGTLKTDNLNFEDIYFLPDKNQILLKIPRKDNMYSFDMKNIVPKESLTCLVTKATNALGSNTELLISLKF
ncbi:hypothetical protein Tco_0967798 [Tanacetum coccineum]